MARKSKKVEPPPQRGDFEKLQKLKGEMIDRLVDGCHRDCNYDEAEGGLVNHCDACCRKITTDLFELIVTRGHKIV